MKVINAKLLKDMFIGGAKQLESKKEWINELNVFPVPDGDTGSNMSMTMNSALNSLINSPNDMTSVCKIIASGTLKGARGNSGVILSQLLKGFTKTCIDYKEINIEVLSIAFQNAVDTGYKAVLKPKEGTILTVAKAAADGAKNIDYENIEDYFLNIINTAEEMLQKTPDMLPVLKEAGVVDSGGQGFIEVLRGMHKVLCGEKIEIEINIKQSPIIKDIIVDEDIKFGYCTEFIINLNKDFTEKDENLLKRYLESIGDSIVCVASDDIVKIHVHTNHPGLAFEKGLEYGELTNMKIDNMREEHRNNLFKKEEKPLKELALVSIVSGSGFEKILNELGVDVIISGGQTMNPSTEDIVMSIKKANAKKVFVFPNNKNIILSANQAKDIIENETKISVVVIPTKNITECISIVIDVDFFNYSEEKTIEIIKKVNTCSITNSIRDTNINGIEIKKDDFIAVDNTGITNANKTVLKTAKSYLYNHLKQDVELVTIYYGIDSCNEEAEKIGEYIKTINDNCDIEIIEGSQPVYNIIIGME